jgi:hypothetical protein
VSLQGNGLLIDLPTGWSGRIFIPGATDEEGESANRPTMHLTSFPVPIDDSSYGSTMVSGMTAGQNFIALVEYAPDVFTPDDVASPDEILADPSAYFDPASSSFPIGLPTLSAANFSDEFVHGESDLLAPTAYQTFFTLGGRPFGLLVMVGDQANVGSVAATANQILQTLIVSPVVQTTLSLNITIPGTGGSGGATGIGTGVAVLASADGTNSERVPASFSFSGGVTRHGVCIDLFILGGILTTTLANGRALSLNMSLTIPGTVLPANVGLLSIEDDPVDMPVAVTLTDNGRCDLVSGVGVVGGFVTTLNSLSSAVGLPATSVTAANAGQVALPVTWSGAGGGSGVLSLYQIGAQRTGVLKRARRSLVGRKRFTIRGKRKVVKVRLSRRARRLLARTHRLRVEAVVQVEDPNGRIARHRNVVIIRPARRR